MGATGAQFRPAGHAGYRGERGWDLNRSIAWAHRPDAVGQHPGRLQRGRSNQEALGVSLEALAASPGLTRSRNSLEGLK